MRKGALVQFKTISEEKRKLVERFTSGCTFCGKPTIGRGLCRSHYLLMRRDGRLNEFSIKKTGLIDRFNKKVSINANGCHEWTGQKNGFGYGIIWRDGKPVRAHRVSYELFKGTLSSLDVVCHACDNPKCVNPEHLFKGTKRDNNVDCTTKGRRPHELQHHACRLSKEDIAAIRSSDMRVCDLATKYDVHQSHISKIRSMKARTR